MTYGAAGGGGGPLDTGGGGGGGGPPLAIGGGGGGLGRAMVLASLALALAGGGGLNKLEHRGKSLEGDQQCTGSAVISACQRVSVAMVSNYQSLSVLVKLAYGGGALTPCTLDCLRERASCCLRACMPAGSLFSPGGLGTG